jgi:hypothetical protein
MGLKIHPEFWTIAKVQAQPKRGVSRDAPPIVDNLGDAVWRDADGFRKRFCDRPYSVRNSSFNISPGVTGANSFPAIVFSS